MARSSPQVRLSLWRRFRQLDPQMRLGLGLILLIIALSILVPLLSPYNAERSADTQLLPPSLTHPFGTDQLGRDMFVRVFAAARLDLLLALIGVSVPLTIGTFIGALAGTTRIAAVSYIWRTVVDAINALPFFVLVMAVVGMLGQGVNGILLAIALTNWARYARLARARALALREVEYVQATRLLGYSGVRTLLRHIIPNVYAETLAYGLSDFALVIVTIAGLSFLGVGVRPPTPEWGAMMSEGRLLITSEPWIILFPGLMLSATAIGVALLAERVIGRARGEFF